MGGNCRKSTRHSDVCGACHAGYNVLVCWEFALWGAAKKLPRFTMEQTRPANPTCSWRRGCLQNSTECSRLPVWMMWVYHRDVPGQFGSKPVDGKQNNGQASERNSASNLKHSCEETSTWIYFDSGGIQNPGRLVDLVDCLLRCSLGGLLFLPIGRVSVSGYYSSASRSLPCSDYLHQQAVLACAVSIRSFSLCRIASGAVKFRSPLSTMNTDPSASEPQLLMAPPPPKPPTSPPFADTVVRPFTSQGSSYAYASPRSPDRRSAEHGSPIDANFGAYISASARTSYTRVDVDSLSVPEYPPLPPLPTAFSMQDVPAALGAAALPATTTTTTTMTPTRGPPTNGTQTPTESHIPQTPQVSLTFLLVSGYRKTQSFEPEITVGRVKELVWNAWPARDAGSLSFPHCVMIGRVVLMESLSIVFGPPLHPLSPTSVPAWLRLAGRTPACAILSPNTISGKDIAGR